MNKQEKKPIVPTILKTSVAALVCAVVLAVLVAVSIVVWIVRATSQTGVSVEVDQRINLTPEQITHIKSIGEWEFLSVADEVLVDTVRKGVFSDDHLVRIYYGTMRLGVNLHQVEPGWLVAQGDSVAATLPPIGLLSRDFIDEARTHSFYETGHWSASDREALFRKAYQQMVAHGLTSENIEAARRQGELSLRQMLRAMGYEHVSIHWRE